MKPTKIAWILVCLSCLGLLVCWLLNRGYGDLSPQGYEITLSLVSVCNRQDTVRLQTIEQMVVKKVAMHELRPQEQAWLEAIIKRAKAGQWESASKSTRQLMNAQMQPALLPELD